jgi:flavin reductase (DIM6/NTAB) family NADH-FMN oxidoreductase RutF
MKLNVDQPAAEGAPSHVHFDFSKLTARDRYKLLIGTVIPRPIAFVTTVDEHGVVNAAPFSFFNCLSADPAIVAIGVENHADMRHKDTGHTVRVTEEFTVNIVDDALVAGMNVCAVPFPPHVDELAMAALTAVKGVHVACPRIAEAPAALECRRYMTIAVGKSREIILGLVLGCFVREGAVNPITKHVDQRKMDASAGSGAMDIRAAATNSIFPRCRWTSGRGAEGFCLAPLGRIDEV